MVSGTWLEIWSEKFFWCWCGGCQVLPRKIGCLHGKIFLSRPCHRLVQVVWMLEQERQEKQTRTTILVYFVFDIGYLIANIRLDFYFIVIYDSTPFMRQSIYYDDL